MFDFFKEVVINSAVLPLEEGTDAQGNQFKRFYAMPAEDTSINATRGPKEGVFRVLRCADYVKSGIADKVIYKTVGRVGSMASATFDVSDLTAGDTYRVLVDISLVNRYYSDYAHPWSEFHKPVIVEFVADGKDDAAKLVKALKSAIPADYKYAVAKVSEDSVVLTCTDPYQVIKSAVLQVLDPAGKPHCECSEEDYIWVKDAEIVANKTPFATGEWIQENLRFPTYPNLRYASPNSDELPVPGALYTQFSFGYCSPRRGLHGQGTVGQMLASVTHHVFYVIDSLAAQFEDELKAAFGNDVEIQVVEDKTAAEEAAKATLTILNNAELTKEDLQGEGEALKATYSGDSDEDVSDEITWTVTPDDYLEIDDNGDEAHLKIKDEQDAQITTGYSFTLKAVYNDVSAEKTITIK